MKSTLVILFVLGTLLTDAYGIKCYDCSYGFGSIPDFPPSDERCQTQGVNSIDCADVCDFADDIGAKGPSYLSKFHFSPKSNTSTNQDPLIPGTTYCGKLQVTQGAQKLVARSCLCIPNDPDLQIGLPVDKCESMDVGGVPVDACTCKTDNCNGESQTTTTTVATTTTGESTTAGTAVPKSVLGSAVFLTAVSTVVGKTNFL